MRINAHGKKTCVYGIVDVLMIEYIFSYVVMWLVGIYTKKVCWFI